MPPISHSRGHIPVLTSMDIKGSMLRQIPINQCKTVFASFPFGNYELRLSSDQHISMCFDQRKSLWAVAELHVTLKAIQMIKK